jgi:hypothetical protein
VPAAGVNTPVPPDVSVIADNAPVAADEVPGVAGVPMFPVLRALSTAAVYAADDEVVIFIAVELP